MKVLNLAEEYRGNKQIPEGLRWLINGIAHGELERKCGIRILESLPFYARSGIHSQIIAEINPDSPHSNRPYWNIMHKMEDMQIVKIERITEHSLGKRKRTRKKYIANIQFLDVINRLYRAWEKFVKFEVSEDESARSSFKGV